MTAHRRDRRRRLMVGVLRLATVAALVVVDLVVTALVTGRVAEACSCVEDTVDSALGEGDAAFIGAAIDRRYEGTPGNDPVVYAFDVTDIVKGELPAQIDVWTGEGDGDCGVQFEIGEPVGVVLRGDRERWRTSTCGGVWLPDELRSPGALAAPTGSGQVALLATGRTGEAMIASFDATGGLAAWGLGNARDELSHLRVCPGSTTAVGMAMNVAGETHVVRRSVATLAPAGSVLLPARQPDSWPQLIDNRGFQCTSPDGDVAFLVSASGYNDAAAGNAVVWVDGDATTVHPVEQGWAFAVHPDLASGYLLSGADGTVVERITFADGNRHTVAELPDGLGGRFLAVEGATGRIAVVATTNPTLHSRGDPAAPDDRLVVLDADGAVLATAALAPSGLVQSMHWLGDDRLLVVWGLPSLRIDVVGLDGAVHSAFAPDERAWGTPAVVGDRLYLPSEDGVVSTTLDGGDPRPLPLSIARVRDVVAVPDGPVAEPQPTRTIPAPTTTSPPPPQPAATTGVTTAISAASPAAAESNDGDTGSNVRAAGIAVGAVAAVGVVVAALVRRRRHLGAT